MVGAGKIITRWEGKWGTSEDISSTNETHLTRGWASGWVKVQSRDDNEEVLLERLKEGVDVVGEE